MKLEELMINDYVKHDQEIIQIQSPDDFELVEEYEPISITTDILLKNNWNRVEDRTYSNLNYPSIKLVIQEWMDADIWDVVINDISCFSISNINELQHLLRLMDKNHIANYLKF